MCPTLLHFMWPTGPHHQLYGMRCPGCPTEVQLSRKLLSWKSQPYFWLDQAPSNSRLEMHHGWSLKDFQLDIKSHLCRMQTYCVCLLFRCIACKMSDHDSWKSIWSKQGEDRSESPESHWNATPLNSCN